MPVPVSRPVGSHTPTARRAGRRRRCPTSTPPASEARAGLRVQLARLGAAARRPGAGRRCSATAARERGVPVYIHASLLVNLGSPTAADGRALGGDAGARAAPRRGDRRAGGGLPRRQLGRPGARRRRRCKQVREALLPLLDAADGRAAGCWSSRARAAAAVAGVAGRAPRAVPGRGRRPPAAGRLLRHLPRLGGRARPGHARRHDRDARRAGRDRRAGPAAAGARQRLQGRVRLDPGPARDVGQGTIGAAAFAELLRHPATAGLPVIVETPSAKGRPATRPTSPCCARCAPDRGPRTGLPAQDRSNR